MGMAIVSTLRQSSGHSPQPNILSKTGYMAQAAGTEAYLKASAGQNRKDIMRLHQGGVLTVVTDTAARISH